MALLRHSRREAAAQSGNLLVRVVVPFRPLNAGGPSQQRCRYHQVLGMAERVFT